MQDQNKSPASTAAGPPQQSVGSTWSRSAGQAEGTGQGHLSNIAPASGKTQLKHFLSCGWYCLFNSPGFVQPLFESRQTLVIRYI